MGLMAEHDNRHDADLGKQADQAIQESFAIQWEQSFRGSHAAGGASRENNAGDRMAQLHLRSARSDSLVKTDLDSARQSDSGARRMAIISATMETAISSGVMAPMSDRKSTRLNSSHL